MLPGLIDGHVHFRLGTLDFGALARWSEVEFGITMATLARQTVERGFTTVRDLDGGLVNARLCRLEGKVGVLAPGAYGDVVISRVDPVEDLTRFADAEASLSHVIQGGQVVVDR